MRQIKCDYYKLSESDQKQNDEVQRVR